MRDSERARERERERERNRERKRKREREKKKRNDMNNIELSPFSTYNYQISYKVHMFTLGFNTAWYDRKKICY